MTRAALRAAALALALHLAAGSAPASTGALPTRLVVVKFDGLPPAVVDRFVGRTDPRTGRSVLPWIDRLFYRDGVRFENFTCRGASLSEPSWTILDTGQPSVIKGNFEYERNTGAVQYHLDFVSFYADAARYRRAYPQSVEALDAAGVPLLSDAFRFEERETGIQLNRRGTKFYDFLQVGLGPFKGPAKEKIGDLLVGVDFHRSYDAATREAFLKAVADPSIRYADMYSANVDEVIHDDNTETGILEALRKADRLIGETAAAIEASGAADRTILVVVSDHGLTFDLNGQYSQGVNLLHYLTKREFGANTVVAHDVARAKYTLKNSVFRPWIESSSVTPSAETFFPDRPERVTCAIDYDGNERAQLQLRSPDLTRLELLAGALRDGALEGPRRAAAGASAIAIVERHRAAWTAEAAEIREEIAAADRLARAAAVEAERLDALVLAHKKQQPVPPQGPPLPSYGGLSKINASDRWTDLVQRAKESKAEAWRYRSYVDQYGEVATSLERRASIRTVEDLLAARPDDVFGPYDLGDRPTVADLLHDPVGLAGVATDPTGALDEASTFSHVNYLEALTRIRVRNAARADGGTAPVAFCAVPVPAEAALRAAVAAKAIDAPDADGVRSVFLVYGSADDQLLLLVRGGGPAASVRAVPVRRFDADPTTEGVSMEAGAWRAGLPFGLYEDPALETGGAERIAWLSTYHGDREWLVATDRTSFGLGVTNLVEVLGTDYRDAFAAAAARDTTADARLVRRLELRRRDASTPDLFVHAAAHWNFDVKDFNAGGNHGGFARRSMDAVLWMRGGPATRVARGPVVVTAPYDALDFAPTVLEAAGVTDGGALSLDLVRGGFRPFPGRIAPEALRRSDESGP